MSNFEIMLVHFVNEHMEIIKYVAVVIGFFYSLYRRFQTERQALSAVSQKKDVFLRENDPDPSVIAVQAYLDMAQIQTEKAHAAIIDLISEKLVDNKHLIALSAEVKELRQNLSHLMKPEVATVAETPGVPPTSTEKGVIRQHAS